MSKTKIFILAILLLLLSNNSISARTEKPFPLKIGIVADTQITTDLGTFDRDMRRKIADVVKVAIRPVAVEMWSDEILNQFMEKFSKTNRVDLVIYLGDGANSGCTDEIEKLFDVLGSHQKKGLPIFYVIGNHDYLGAGNTSDTERRGTLCQRQEDQPTKNGFLTKYDLIRKISKFNSESAAISNGLFEYSDNIQSIEANIKPNRNPERDHFQMFLAGLLKYTNPDTKQRVEILLADTSDYRDSPFASKLGFSGMHGAISFEDKNSESQISYYERVLKESAFDADYRFVASHYPLYNLDLLDSQKNKSKSKGKMRTNLKRWTSGHKKTDYWLSGHKHSEAPSRAAYTVGEGENKGMFEDINVGSTTDYLPHTAIFADKNGKLEIEKLTLDVPDSDMDFMLNLIKEIETANDIRFVRICEGKTKEPAETMFGLNGAYRKRCWETKSQSDASKNLTRFLELEEIKHWKKDRIIAALFHIASKDENE